MDHIKWMDIVSKMWKDIVLKMWMDIVKIWMDIFNVD
jgi:hypothetical protein